MSFLLILTVAGSLWSQASEPAAQAPSKKTKKVYTEEDLKKLRKVNIFGTSSAEDVPEKSRSTTSAKPEVKRSPLIGCEKPSLAWAAVIMVAAQDAGLNLSIDYWHQKVIETMYCTDRVPPPETIASLANGEHLLPDLRREKLIAKYTKGVATAETLVLAFRAERPTVLVWKGSPYLVKGMTYSERVLPSGNLGSYAVSHLFTVDTLILFDPFSGAQKTFTRGENKEEEITASIEFSRP